MRMSFQSNLLPSPSPPALFARAGEGRGEGGGEAGYAPQRSSLFVATPLIPAFSRPQVRGEKGKGDYNSGISD